MADLISNGDSFLQVRQAINAKVVAVDASLAGKADADHTHGPGLITASVTYAVGTGGDYETLNDALIDLSKSYPVYVSGGVTVTLQILTGTTITTPMLLKNIDLGWITITSVDVTVPVNVSTYLMTGRTAVCPTISCVFDMAPSGAFKHGVVLENGSTMLVTTNKGVINAGGNNFTAQYGSTLIAYGAIATGAGSIAAAVTGASRAELSSANLSGAGTYGVFCSGGSFVSAGGVNAASAGAFGFGVATGGCINAAGTTGTISKLANTVTAAGIIFE